MRLPTLLSVRREEIQLPQPIEQLTARFAHEPGTVLLLSGSNQDCAQYHILGLRPWLTLKGRPGRLSLTCGGETQELESDPFEVLTTLVDHYRDLDFHTDQPIGAGLLGYFSYDLKDCIEELPQTCMDSGLPDICLYAPSILVVQEKATHSTFLYTPVLETGSPDPGDIIAELAASPATGDRPETAFSVDPRGLISCFTKDEYVRAVQKIIAYLKAGDIYQANFSQQFSTGFSGNAYALFLELYQRNPAPFFAYINAGDHQVLSTSPERFIRQAGTQVETRPIKGTIARGGTPEQDLCNREALCASVKDDAELTMIVDLMRNDLSRVTTHGSVVVTEHKRLEPWDNVYHLVSIVRGELSRGNTPVDLIKATFPGGSITGCPKIRSMEIIDELEPVRRHVYTGSIGFLSFHDTMDLSIAIRTAVVHDGRIRFSVGGGIVYDSDPEKEFQETLDKGKTLMDALAAAASPEKERPARAWINGKMADRDRAAALADTPGFQYGAGLFETIRVEQGHPLWLNAHMDRMAGSWQALFNASLPDITWHRVVDLLLRENSLCNTTAVVKLMVSMGRPGELPGVFGFAAPYVHRLKLLDKTGLDLVTCPHARQTPLASHKTMNYLFYERAGAWARKHWGDEALILNPDGTVSETNTCNILIRQGNRILLPASPHALPGVAQAVAAEGLAREGFGIETTPISLDALSACSDILLTNSLMGAVPAARINGVPIHHSNGFTDRVNRILAKG